MKDKDINKKDARKFFENYPKLDITTLNMTFGVLYDSCIEVLGKRRTEVLRNESDSVKQKVIFDEMLRTAEEILWEIMKELGWKDTRANRFFFKIKLMEDSRKYSIS